MGIPPKTWDLTDWTAHGSSPAHAIFFQLREPDKDMSEFALEDALDFMKPLDGQIEMIMTQPMWDKIKRQFPYCCVADDEPDLHYMDFPVMITDQVPEGWIMLQVTNDNSRLN